MWENVGKIQQIMNIYVNSPINGGCNGREKKSLQAGTSTHLNSPPDFSHVQEEFSIFSNAKVWTPKPPSHGQVWKDLNPIGEIHVIHRNSEAIAAS